MSSASICLCPAPGSACVILAADFDASYAVQLVADDADEIDDAWAAEIAARREDVEASRVELVDSEAHHDAQATRAVCDLVEVSRRDHTGRRVMERRHTGETDAHVYHVALSVRAEEGMLGDETWRQTAGEFVDRNELEP